MKLFSKMKNEMIIANQLLAVKVGYLFQLTVVFNPIYSHEHYGTKAVY